VCLCVCLCVRVCVHCVCKRVCVCACSVRLCNRPLNSEYTGYILCFVVIKLRNYGQHD